MKVSVEALCFAPGFAFADFSVDVAAGFVDITLLGDAGNVEHAVDPAVAAEVESVLDRFAGAFTGGQRDGPGAAPACELGLAGEPVRITDFDHKCGRSDRSDAWLVAQCGAVLIEEVVDVSFELADLTACLAVTVDERDQPRQPVRVSQRRDLGDVELLESAQRDSILPVALG